MGGYGQRDYNAVVDGLAPADVDGGTDVFMVRNVGCRRLSECAGHGSGGYYVDVHDTGSCDRPVCDEGTCAVYSLARKWGTCKLPW